jgi:hypothetical protein
MHDVSYINAFDDPGSNLRATLLCSTTHFLLPNHGLKLYSTTERYHEAPSPALLAAGAGMVSVRHNDCTASLGNGS